MGSQQTAHLLVERPHFVTLDCAEKTALKSLYSDLVAHCLEHDVRNVLVRASGRDDDGYLELRNALVRLVLESGPLGFSLAMVGAPSLIKAGFRTLLTDLRYTGIRVRWFESEKDAVAWLECG